MVEPIDMKVLYQKVKEDLEKVPLNREALQKSLDEIKNGLVLQQPLLDGSVLRTVADDVLKDIIMNTMNELSSVPSLSQQSPLPASTDRDFVAGLSGGSALCATVLGLDETNPFCKAPFPFLRKLDPVDMFRPMMEVQEKFFYFTDTQESSRFHESVKSFGYSVAASLNFANIFSTSVSNSSDSKTRHSSGHSSKSEKIYLYKVGFYPIGAFRFPLNRLEMSEEAHSELLSVTNESQAENYLRRFGSHISADLYHYGGLMIYQTQVQRKVDRHILEDIATAAWELQASVSGVYGKIQAGAAVGFHNSSSDFKMSENSTEKLAFAVGLDAYGPKTSNPSLFYEILKRDRATNYLIDKGSFSSRVLCPVWEIARKRKDPNVDKVSKILLEVWLKKTKYTTNARVTELREQYLEQMQFVTQDRLLSVRKCKMLQNDQKNEDVEISEREMESGNELPTTKMDVDGLPESEGLLQTSSKLSTPGFSPKLEQLQSGNEDSGNSRGVTDASSQANVKTFLQDYPPAIDLTKQNTVDDQNDEDVEMSGSKNELKTKRSPTKTDGQSTKSNLTLPESSSEPEIPAEIAGRMLEQLHRKKEESKSTKCNAYASSLTYKTFVLDYPPIADGCLEYNLLHRLNLEASTLFAAALQPGPGRKRGNKSTEKARPTNFDIPSLFKKYPLHDCANIIQLLLERRYAIPIMPDLLKNVGLLRVVRRTEMDPFLSDDVKLLRVVIVSYVDKQLSKTAFLLKDGFHVSSSLIKDNDDICEAEVGQGFIAVNDSLISCIVLHILGPFTDMWDVITKFADYLIIEEPHSQNLDEHDSIIDKYKKLTGLPSFVTAWIPSEGNPEYYDEQTPFFIVKSNMQEFIHQLSTDIADGLEVESTHQNCLTSLFHLPFDAKTQIDLKSKVSTIKALETYRTHVFQLEKSFKEEGQLIAKRRDFHEKNDPLQRKKLETGIVKEKKRRMEHAGKTEEEPLIQLLLHCLSMENTEQRILALRAMEDAISSNIMKSKKVKELNKAYSSLQAEYRDLVQAKGVHDPEVVSKRKKVLQRKEERNNTILSIDHVWREVSLLYCARSTKFQHLPQKAASCLLSGIPLELFNGDANMVNVEWSKCVLQSLQQMLPKKRILVLSVLGEQSCGKSTLLNVMFGIRFRTSVGRCTNGLMMTLIKSENRTEYDYILILDTEGIRSPEHWGLSGCEKRDNQIASFAILPSDATILVVKGENDNALKDILPIVLMAYRGSELAEKELGTLSSRFFVVYNQVMVTQKDKLESIIQSLSTSLVESFSTVSNMKVAGSQITFRALLKNVSSTTKSDICVLGCVSNGEPPMDIPNFSFSKQVMSFREHIHQSIVQTPGWIPREISNFSDNVDLVWKCLESADFDLSYLSLKERSNRCRLDKAVEKIEKDFSEKYESTYESVLGEKRKEVENEEELNTTIDSTKARLSNLMSVHVSDFYKQIDLLLNEEDFKKWQTDIEDRQKQFFDSTSSHWHHTLELSLRNQLYFKNRLLDYQRDMRNKMNQLFKNKQMNPKDDRQFEILFQEMLQKAEKENPPVDVELKVLNVYRNNPIMKTIDADLIAPAATWLNKFWKVLQNPVKEAREYMRKFAFSDNKVPEDRLPNRLSRIVYQKLEGKQYYSETVVQDIVEEANKIILREKIQSKEYQNECHSFVRKLLTDELKLIQAKWEESNSIHARLKTKKTEMKQQYLDISKGLQAIDRLNSKLVYFFKEVTSEAFRQDIREQIIRSVMKKQWYNSVHHLQGHIDLFLMEVEESFGIDRVLNRINDPKKLRRSTILSLIEKEIKDTEVKWKYFKDRTEQCICSALENSRKMEGCKAVVFIHTELPSLLGDAFISNFFQQELISQIQVAFDESEFQNTNQEFLQIQLQPLVNALHSCQAKTDKKKLASEVFNFLKEKSPDKNSVCALCEERCRLCGGLCFRKRMHDGIFHDTCHQPEGLIGGYLITSDTILASACNTTPLDWRFTIDNQKTWHPYRDYSKVFNTWIQPDPDASSSEYRQYLMYKYNDAIASYHGKKPSTDVPPYYERDLSQIRENIKCRVLYSEDYPSC